MTLPAYAEELKRLAMQFRGLTNGAIALEVAVCVDEHIDRILRDAAIAQAAMELVALYERGKDAMKPYKKLAALIAKETP